MPRQFLNGPRRCAPHREVRAERVPEGVHAAVVEARPTRRPPDPVLELPIAKQVALGGHEARELFELSAIAGSGQPQASSAQAAWAARLV